MYCRSTRAAKTMSSVSMRGTVANGVSELSGCSLDDVDDRLDSRADCVRPGAAPTVSGLALGASSCDDRGRGPEDRGLADLVARRRKRASVLAPKGRGGPVAEAGRLLPGGPSWSDWKEQA